MEYKCYKCNKYYKTYQTLWKHNKEFHDDKNTTVQNVQLNVQNVQSNVQLNKSLTCEICNKVFNSRSSKSMHKKNCNNKISELDKIKEETKQKRKVYKRFLETKIFFLKHFKNRSAILFWRHFFCIILTKKKYMRYYRAFQIKQVSESL